MMISKYYSIFLEINTGKRKIIIAALLLGETMLAKNNIASLDQKSTGLENLAFAFLIARRAEKMRQPEPAKITRPAHEKYFYRAKEFHQLICLTPRQHQCLWLYHQHKNIKSVALSLSLSERAAEEHLKLARKKFQMRKLTVLMRAIDQRLIECVAG